MMTIAISQHGKVFLQCRYMHLEPYAPSVLRRLDFSDIMAQQEIPALTPHTLHVIVYCNDYPVYTFHIEVSDYEKQATDTWWVTGELQLQDDSSSYRQGLIDILYQWQQGTKTDWWSYALHSPEKADYLSACYCCSTLQSAMIHREKYEIDVSQVKEASDILYLLGELFFGPRGYIGRSWEDLEHYLLLINNKPGQLSFLNADKVTDKDLLEEAYTLLYERGITVDYYGNPYQHHTTP